MADKLPQIMIPNRDRTIMTKYYPPLAEEIGDRESLLLLQLEFWLHMGKKIKWEDGIAWLDMAEREITREMGMKHNAVRVTLEQMEIRGLILRKQPKQGVRRRLALNWETVRGLNSIKVVGGDELFEDATKLFEDRTQQDKESLDSKESLLLQEIETLKAEIKALKAGKKKDTAVPDDWNDVLGHINSLWPRTAGKSVQGLGKILREYPAYWPQIKTILTSLHKEAGDRIKVPGAVAYKKVAEMAVDAQFGGQPSGGEKKESPKPQESKPVPSVDFEINWDAVESLGGGR